MTINMNAVCCCATGVPGGGGGGPGNNEVPVCSPDVLCAQQIDITATGFEGTTSAGGLTSTLQAAGLTVTGRWSVAEDTKLGLSLAYYASIVGLPVPASWKSTSQTGSGPNVVLTSVAGATTTIRTYSVRYGHVNNPTTLFDGGQLSRVACDNSIETYFYLDWISTTINGASQPADFDAALTTLWNRVPTCSGVGCCPGKATSWTWSNTQMNEIGGSPIFTSSTPTTTPTISVTEV